MHLILTITNIALLITLGLSPKQSFASDILIAVASNFKPAMTQLASEFEKNSNHKLLLSYGSTGKHYAQIHNGAPFDVFLAADQQRPKLLEDNNLCVKGSRFTYAIGQLALWSLQGNLISSDEFTFKHSSIRHLAIANPKLAPYGIAAKETLKKMKLWASLQNRIVRGENIAQT